MSRSHVVIIGASLKNYTRVDSIISALKSVADVTILPTPAPDKPYRLSFLVHALKALYRTFTINVPRDTDFVVVLFPDNENVWTALLYRYLYTRHYKIVFDPFISIYDTYLYNKPLRALSYPVLGRLLAQWLWWYESRLFNSVDILLTDTDNHGRYLTKTLGITQPFHKLLLSADETLFAPTRLTDDTFWRERPLRVLWYGKISLMHGVDYIWQALEELSADQPGPLEVTLIGDFSSFDQTKINQLQQTGTLVYLAEKPPQYVGQAKIIECITHSHILLGMFGRTDKSSNVITNKEYEALCSGRCLVTLQGHREFLQHNRNCVMVDPTKPAELTAALQALNHDRSRAQRIAQQGREDYLQYASQERLTSTVRDILGASL